MAGRHRHRARWSGPGQHRAEGHQRPGAARARCEARHRRTSAARAERWRLTTAARVTHGALIAALSGAVCQAAAALPGPTPDTRALSVTAAPAAWTKHTMTFGYQGMTTRYSCEGLKGKMRALLRYFGARPESIRLNAYGCAGGPYRASPAVNL